MKRILLGGKSRIEAIGQAQIEGMDGIQIFHNDENDDGDGIGGIYPQIKGLSDEENLKVVSKVALLPTTGDKFIKDNR